MIILEDVIIVILDYDPKWKPMEWAKKHCPSYIANDTTPIHEDFSDTYRYRVNYYFGNEKDALMFRLRWE